MNIDEPDEKKKNAMINNAKNLLSQRALTASLKLAANNPLVSIRKTDFDANPWLLNVRNGIVDLKTGNLNRHNPLDLTSRMAPVKYTEETECPEYMKMMRQVYGDDDELIEFVEQSWGYALTGDTKEKRRYHLTTRTPDGVAAVPSRTCLSPSWD